MKQPLAIGVDNYKEIIEKPYYYVDKTLLIRELLDTGGKVSLFTRPRRFGKTLALSMIRTFFEKEITYDGQVVDNSGYFSGKKIMEAGARYTDCLGKYPVIALSLKSAKQPSYEMAYRSIVDEIAKEYDRHSYVLGCDRISHDDQEKFKLMRGRRAEAIDYAKALEFLSLCLQKYHGEKTIILIDEYDVPLENAYFAGFYERMIQFIRSLFESALKTNENLQFAVVTGCLRIGKESIFTGLNNLEIISVLNDNYAEYFGFTSDEVQRMLEFYDIAQKAEEAKEWYDGYLFGDTEVYNPWSMINYVKTAVTNRIAYPQPYWSNTSSNSIIREMVEHAGPEQKMEIETLIAGGTIEKPVHEEITYADIHKTQDNLWNFLFFTGYLKAVSRRFEEDTIYLTMEIPNYEVRYIYRNTIREWFEEQVIQADKTPLQEALLGGDAKEMELIMRRQLMSTISYYDNEESFYHGYLAGMLQNTPEYFMRSNREAGNGRPDIQLVSYDLDIPAIIIEIKKADAYTQMEERAQEALQQIEDRKYDEELRLEGYHEFLHYGICFCKKNCCVRIKKS